MKGNGIKMNKNYTVMELEAIKKLCKCVNSVASLPTNLIADTNVSTLTTYSSYKIDVEMSALENDIQKYVDTALAGLNKLTKEVIDDKALVVKENVLYLYKDPTDINNDYMQMMLINGVAIELGSTTCDFSSVYSKDEIDDKFALKIDLDVLTTSFNNLVTTVDKKIDKDKIVTVLDDTVTDEQVASALLTKTELDKTNAKLGEKANTTDFDALKTKVDEKAKIDDTSTSALDATWSSSKIASETEKKKQVMRLPYTVSNNKFSVKYSDVTALIDKYCNFADNGAKQNAYVPFYLTCYTTNNNTVLSCFARFEGGIYLDKVVYSSNESSAEITKESEVNFISIELGGTITSLFVTI